MRYHVILRLVATFESTYASPLLVKSLASICGTMLAAR
jgi:hypothetical protein